MARKSTNRKSQAKKSLPTPEVLIGQIIRERRMELGSRQVDLEGEVSLDRTYISKLERGQFQPCLRALLHLERVLQFSTGDLFKELVARMEAAGSND